MRTATWHALPAAHEPTVWLRDVVATLRRRVSTGHLTRCRHLTGPYGAVALWDPRRIVCADCFPLLTPGSALDRTCDRCGQVPDRIHPCRWPMITAAGIVEVFFGLCPGCVRREAPGCTMCKETER